MGYRFTVTYESKKVHVSRNNNQSVCGAYWGGHVEVVEKEHERYPLSMEDVCSNCRRMEDVEGFLVKEGLMTKPDAVIACVHVDLNIPKKMIPISEARELIEEIRANIAKFEGLDAGGFCVKFKVRHY